MASQRNTVSSGGLKSTGKNGGKGKNPASFGRGTRTDLLSCLPARRVAWAPAVEEDNKTRDSPDLPGLLLHYYPPLLSFSGLIDWWLNETGGQFIRGVCSEAEKNQGQWSIYHLLYATTGAFKKLLPFKLGAKQHDHNGGLNEVNPVNHQGTWSAQCLRCCICNTTQK